jgi:hypothetical protein
MYAANFILPYYKVHKPGNAGCTIKTYTIVPHQVIQYRTGGYILFLYFKDTNIKIAEPALPHETVNQDEKKWCISLHRYKNLVF